MASKPRDAEKRAAESPDTAAQPDQPSAAGGPTTAAAEEGPVQTAERRIEGRRGPTVNLPFVTAEFHAPELRAPSREDIGAAARGARSMLPSGKSLLFYGGLAATAVAGVIEWPVAVAIGVGTALASQGETAPTPRGGEQERAEATSTGASGASA